MIEFEGVFYEFLRNCVVEFGPGMMPTEIKLPAKFYNRVEEAVAYKTRYSNELALGSKVITFRFGVDEVLITKEEATQ